MLSLLFLIILLMVLYFLYIALLISVSIFITVLQNHERIKKQANALGFCPENGGDMNELFIFLCTYFNFVVDYHCSHFSAFLVQVIWPSLPVGCGRSNQTESSRLESSLTRKVGAWVESSQVVRSWGPAFAVSELTFTGIDSVNFVHNPTPTTKCPVRHGYLPISCLNIYLFQFRLGHLNYVTFPTQHQELYPVREFYVCNFHYILVTE